MSRNNEFEGHELDWDRIEHAAVTTSCSNQPPLISIKDVHTKIEGVAIAKTFEYMFAQGRQILRIASGIATIKGLDGATEEEVAQAIAIYKYGHEHYLP